MNPEVVVWREHGFEIYIGSHSDSKFWESLVNEVGPVDIVLDDGGHTFLQQITTVESLVSAITPDGLIVVEDTHTSYMKEFSPKTGSTFIDYAFSIIHGINYRFGAFGTSYEKAVYSIQFFESIVAFRINSEKCIKSSSSINNENIIGYDSRDYRYGDSITFTSTKYKNLYIKLKRIPLVYSLLKNIHLAIKEII